MLVSLSVKQGPSGAEIAQQNYLWQIDVPNLLGGALRINPEVSYNHTINYGYFGLGNASSGAPPPPTNPNPGRYYEWIDSVVQVRSSARVHIEGNWSALFAVQYLFVGPTAYADSLLAHDAATRNPDGSPLIRGTTPLSLPSLAAGFVYDSRDDEIFPRRGMLHEVGVRFEQGLPTGGGVRYAEAGAILRGYVPLVGPLVAAGRLVTNFQFGDVPFYDLFQAGPFDQKEMPGRLGGDPWSARRTLPRADQGRRQRRASRDALISSPCSGRSSPSATTSSSTPAASGAITPSTPRSTGPASG